MIKDAGFESAMGDQLLHPLLAEVMEPPATSQPIDEEDQGPIVSDGSQPDDDNDHGPVPSEQQQELFMETSRVSIEKSRIEDWSSSPLFPTTGDDSDIQNAGDTPASSKAPELSSSPPVSPQLTVEYPHISQIELRSSAAPLDESTRQSSSHQDAQRVPAVIPNPDLTVSVKQTKQESHNTGINFQEDDDLESLQSEVAQTQSQDQDDDDEDDDEGESGSFLGKLGYDGHVSSYHESDDDPSISDNDSSLPSLRELTSSQKRKITTTSSKSKKVSPPLLKRKNNLRNLKTRKASTPRVEYEIEDNINDEDDELAFPAPSQPPIKISASQAEKPSSLSHIPLRTQVVDLTMSSDPVSPDNSDGEYGVMRPRRARRSRRLDGGSKPKTRASTFGVSVGDVGIGTKQFLTTKKTRSQAVGGKAGGGYF